ncbi:MAG: phosphate-starvation-inducible PsiE family protein [Gallionella sp.]
MNATQLITAEIRYLEGGKLEVDTFVVVALVGMLRKVITLPVLEVAPPMREVILWEGGALLLGVLYLVVRWAQRPQLGAEKAAESPKQNQLP